MKTSKAVFNFYKKSFIVLETLLRSRFPHHDAGWYMARIEAKFSRNALQGVVIRAFENGLTAEALAKNILNHLS